MSTSDKDNVIIPATDHTQDNGDDEETAPAINQPNWQEEKTLGECMLHVYESGMLADISFRCSDHVTGDTADRLRAHKMVLATRSAVFFAMFYGPNRDDSTEEIVSEFSKQAMDTFLRYLYSDTAPLEIGIAEDVFKIAHYYQVPKLVKLCCEFILQNIGCENACTFLELALLYEQHEFRDNISDFIDSNAKAILESDSFLSLSKDTLKYLLKGDTFHLEEITILKAVHAWATLRLTAEGHEVSGENIRKLLGEDVFYHIRMPTMSIQDFIKVERMFNYHSKTETTNIASFIVENRNPKRLAMHSSKPRVERFKRCQIYCETIIARVFSTFTDVSSMYRNKTAIRAPELSLIGNPKFSMTFHDNRSLLNSHILSISLNIPEFCVPCREETHKLDHSFRVSYEIRCVTLGYLYNNAQMMTSGSVTLALHPPLTLSKNDVTLTVEIIPPLQISFLNAPKNSRQEAVTIKICRSSQRNVADEDAHDDEGTLPEDWEDVFKPSSGQRQYFLDNEINTCVSSEVLLGV